MRALSILSLAAAASAGTVSLDLHRGPVPRSHRTAAQSFLMKRGAIDLVALNKIIGYWAAISVGTPGQEQLLLLDTGSSDTWVNSAESGVCDGSALSTCIAAFDPDQSTSFESLGAEFEISYIDGSVVRGTYFVDRVAVDGNEISSQQLGLAQSVVSTINTGIMGLGFPAAVAAEEIYPTLLESMVSAGHIERAAFSMYLNDDDASTGTILFGGIDAAKFTGSLTSIPLGRGLIPGSNVTLFYTVDITSLAVTPTDGGDSSPIDGGENMNITAILDSGSTLTFMPSSIVEEIGGEFEVVMYPLNDTMNVALIPCKYAGDEGRGRSVDFTFSSSSTSSSARLSVSVEELVYDIGEQAVSQIFESLIDPEDPPFDIDDTCVFGLQGWSFVYGDQTGSGMEEDGLASLTDRIVLVGDTVLRSAYVVYDMENELVGIAQAKFNATGGDIVELKAGETTLPEVTGVEDSTEGDDVDDEASGGSGGNGDGGGGDEEGDGDGDGGSGAASFGISTALSLLMVAIASAVLL